MAKKGDHRIYNISVVGMSGTEKEKGVVGVGKSCLCNRFVRPLADDYHTDHISVLSQSDFGGCVVNNDHFLYWGEVTKTTDDGQDLTFNVIEQTEFIDDSSFLPFKSGKTDPYIKRCAGTKIQSAEKLMYICKNQLGLEHEFDRHLMPEGKLNIDGFICVYDISQNQQRPVSQVEYVGHILNNLNKTKKPVVLVTTKQDDANRQSFNEFQQLINRREFRNSNIQIVETSAHRNVNVELAFIVLAQLIDKNKGRTRIVPYLEAEKIRQEILDVAHRAYQNLVRSQVTDYKSTWREVHKKFVNNGDFNHFVDLFGMDSASKIFRRHVLNLKENHIQRKEETYLKALPDVLKAHLPDLKTIGERAWPNCQQLIYQHEKFNEHFVVLQETPWHETDHIDSTDHRIPYDLLSTPEAETLFRNYLNALHAEAKKSEMKRQFKHLLEDNPHVTPGKHLQEVSIFFLGRECYDTLSDVDRAQVYDQHQKEIKDDAKKDFLELLYDRSDIFAQYDPINETITTQDLQNIMELLKDEPRYKQLGKLEEDRKVMLLNHLGFMQWPSRERCPFREDCMENHIERTLNSHRIVRSESSNRSNMSYQEQDCDDTRLNLVLLGTDGLADDLANDIRSQCPQDEFIFEGFAYSLDYRTIDGDVSLPHNSFKTANFTPDGCICVYNTAETLEYIRDSLEKAYLYDLETADITALPPIVIVQVFDPSHTEKGIMILREEGQTLADNLQCPFVDIPVEMSDEPTKFKLHPNQIQDSLTKLIQLHRQRYRDYVAPYAISECIEPDIRVVMCMMCADHFSVDIPLGPLLGHQSCYVSMDKYSSDKDKYPTISVETYLGECKRKVEIIVTSYHGASLLKDELNHGFILVYSAKRKASLATLNYFTNTIPPEIPVQIVAVTESGGANVFFSNEHAQALITEGNSLADKLGLRFMTTSASFQQQIAAYNPFFNEAWEARDSTESKFSYMFSGDEMSTSTLRPEPSPNEKVPNNSIDRRPPATLPKPPDLQHGRKDSFGAPKGSGSNSTEESDPVYDNPHHSDSEPERASSTSPPYYETYAVPRNQPVERPEYSDIANNTPNGDHLVRPSQLKNRRNQYAEHRMSCPVPSESIDKNNESNELASVDKYPHYETLEPPGASAPEPAKVEEFEHMPRYQFRKSRSMRLALRQEDEGWAVNSQYESASGRRLQKASTLPDSRRQGMNDDTAWMDNQMYAGQQENDWEGERGENVPLSGKVKPPTKPKPLNMSKFENVKEAIKKNQKQPKKSSQHYQYNKIQAPLATPEQIEIGDYAQVADALDQHEENDYALVQDALPPGKLYRIRSTLKNKNQHKLIHKGGAIGTDSDSEFSSLERKPDNIYARVNRKPTPHKKKLRSQRKSDPSHYSESSPLIPDYVPGRELKVVADDINITGRSHSPSEGSEGTDDQVHDARKQKKKRSFRKKKVSDTTPLLTSNLSPPTSDPDQFAKAMEVNSVDDSHYYEDVKFKTQDVWQPLKKPEKDLEKQRKEEKKIQEAAEKKKKKEEEKRKGKLSSRSFRSRLKKKNKGPPPSSEPQKMTLDNYVQKEQRIIPLFVEKCIKFIEKEGLDAEGIYRVPGNKAHVELLHTKYAEDPNVDIESLDIPVNAVATALKGFFSDLHEPLIPAHLYDELIEAAGIPDKSARHLALRGVLKKLPPVNHDVLKYLMTHIFKVTQKSELNNMDSKNLAICWWPTLLRPEFSSFEKMAAVSKYLEEIIQTLICQYGFFFCGQDEI